MPHFKSLPNKKSDQHRLKPIISKYMTRSQAIKRLSLNMSQFRRLCILKGIHPRVPPKTTEAQERQIFYTRDDISSLVHDKVTAKLLSMRAFKKKLQRLENRKEFGTKKIVERSCVPQLDLKDTIRERYPTFADCLKDLGDCLSMVYMFASQGLTTGERSQHVKLARRYVLEWEAYVKHQGLLRKCFISTKGFFYTASVCGIPVTWIVPHEFMIEKSETVDFNVLHEFLNFYVILMKFVCFKLYNTAGLVYPPRIDYVPGTEFLGEVHVERIAESKKKTFEIKQIKQEKPIVVDELIDVKDAVKGSENAIATEMAKESGVKSDETIEKEKMEELDTNNRIEEVDLGNRSGQGLMSGLVFYVQKEVAQNVKFVIECVGGMIVTDVNDEQITHQVGERGEHKTIAREFVQPQWIFDCVNENFLLPCAEYEIGKKLPPHLSPYGNGDGDYISERRKELDNIKKGHEYNYDEDAEKKEKASKEIITEDMEGDFVKGMLEEQGKEIPKPHEGPKSLKTKEMKAEEDEKKRKMVMLVGKKRRAVMKDEFEQRKKKRTLKGMHEKLLASKKRTDKKSDASDE
ncbi:hypothetical protein EIN_487950 [Entamoeba invadens IP1]|uniref:Pescadillo homolog n=1 Tax=Entamoeba invadens IP1 TaxID=370355 RepID=A0A0A1UAV1_ENTIV|nr:hypothetical protein EIN_487950 [Entamoeba invadens IP1]ELP89283.1 hypothetical protein EIN_487950 [Entamoeba invadens IP1]|eukprot:XP_004256054.1 hypothetical protein EIN_487950 [Entamoeba invadens IP1]